MAGFVLKTGQEVTVNASYGGTCGVVGSFVFTTSPIAGLSATPNPASAALTVAATDEGAGTTANNGVAPSFGVELHDAFGKKVKAMTSRQGEAVLEVGTFPTASTCASARAVKPSPSTLRPIR